MAGRQLEVLPSWDGREREVRRSRPVRSLGKVESSRSKGEGWAQALTLTPRPRLTPPETLELPNCNRRVGVGSGTQGQQQQAADILERELDSEIRVQISVCP